MKRIARLFALMMLVGAAPPERVDLIISGGTIYTGADAPFVGDVAVSGDRIRAVGRHLSYRAARVIDARGMIVAPGFIDAHTHVGGQLAAADAHTRLIPAFLMQGVTTAMIGNDGGGSPDVAGVLGSARLRPVGINYAAYVGFGAVREAVIGEADRAADARGAGPDAADWSRPGCARARSAFRPACSTRRKASRRPRR